MPPHSELQNLGYGVLLNGLAFLSSTLWQVQSPGSLLFKSTTPFSPFTEPKQKNLDSTNISYFTQISFFATLYRLVFLV